jgi:hypothetical protein
MGHNSTECMISISDAFSTAGTNGQTLKTILESETIPKVFFDVRNDSDALYSQRDGRDDLGSRCEAGDC